MTDLEQFRSAWLSELSHKAGPNKPKRELCENENATSPPPKTSRYVFHLESNTAFQGNPRAFEIADRLLQGEVLTDDDLFKKSIKRTVTSSSSASDKLPSKLTRSERRNNRKSFLDTLIDDLNETTDIPFFDVCLPREVAVKIFRHLDVVDLCRCAQVSRSWRCIAEDDLLWHKHCCQMGLAKETSSSMEKADWKNFFREQLQKESILRRNWKNRIGRLYEMVYSQGGVLCAVNSNENCVAAGYSNGEIRLWKKTPDGVEIHDMEWGTDVISERSANHVTSIALSKDHVIVGYADGSVWRVEDLSSECSRGNLILQTPSPARVIASATNNSFLASGGTEMAFVDDAGTVQQVRLPTKITHTAFISTTNAHRKEGVLVSVAEDAVRMHSVSTFHDDGISLHHLIGATVTCLDATERIVAFGAIDRSAVNVFQAPVYAVTGARLLGTLRSHTSSILCVRIPDCPENLILTGSCDKNARIFDLRTMHCEVRINAHGLGVSQVEMDEHNLVTGGEDGLVCVWDLRTKAKLWEMFCRHPVRYLRTDLTTLVTAHLPQDLRLEPEDGSIVVHARQRGSVRMYDFAADQETKGIPSICLSSYDEPAGYNYNVRLAVPYDDLE
ncbi:F-box/WD repeat-containing protein 8-like [Ornithodoros turicata]|uniref:F-box/WD repeat-containing protein 8-like n=1 Tax=Ornithodoros turicata TaxID=34597 RepID=UPI003138809C